MIKTKLNEFEADWAAMPVIEKDELNKLKNKTILISGHSIARCLCYALLYQNEAKALNIRVIFSDTDNGRIKELFLSLCSGTTSILPIIILYQKLEKRII